MTNTVTHTIKNTLTLVTQSFEWMTILGPLITLFAAAIAARVVIWSQRQFDRRQRNDHKLNTEMKSNELLFAKKEELVKSLIKFRIAQIDKATIFFNDRDEHKVLENIKLNEFADATRECVDIRSQCSMLVKIYFKHLESSIKAIEISSQEVTLFQNTLVLQPISQIDSNENTRLLNVSSNLCNILIEQVINDNHNNLNLFKRH
ncbi:MAG: hypothetical protein H7Z73_04470 [Candidatus Saccharibacteria bacterium]|nr:hypothetical protein [Moraxellaceae bacterium]